MDDFADVIHAPLSEKAFPARPLVNLWGTERLNSGGIVARATVTRRRIKIGSFYVAPVCIMHTSYDGRYFVSGTREINFRRVNRTVCRTL